MGSLTHDDTVVIEIRGSTLEERGRCFFKGLYKVIEQAKITGSPVHTAVKFEEPSNVNPDPLEIGKYWWDRD